MKHCILIVALICLGSIASAQGLSTNIGSTGFSIGISTTMNDAYIVGGWDFVNKEPIAGYGKEIFPIGYHGNEVLYIAGQNLFYPGEAGRGAFGVSLGARPLAAINAVGTICGVASQIVTLPKWTGGVSQFASVEVGYARRGLFGEAVPQGQKSDVVAVLGKINIPISDWFGYFSK